MVCGNSNRLILASNRLPLSIHEDDGKFKAAPSSGGFVTVLRGLSETNYLWLGWPGMEINETKREDDDVVLRRENAPAVYLSNTLAQNHYNEF